MKMKSLLPIIFALLLLSTLSHGADAAALIKQGDQFDQQLENKKALDTYLAASKLSPPDADILRRISKEYAELMADTNSTTEKLDLGNKALDYSKQAVALAPKNALAQLGLAICYGRLAPLMDNKTKIAYSREVKEHADQALALDPGNDLTYNVLGSWNYELAGLNSFLRALAGMIYGKVPDATYQDAIKDFQKAIALNPNRLANHIGLGRAEAASGNPTDARKEIQLGLSMPSEEKDDDFVKNQGRETLSKL
jgi:tetratricopeptide (TPR) repeat protein